MDFTLSDDQQAIVELAGTILADHCSPEALRKLEQADNPTSDPAGDVGAGGLPASGRGGIGGIGEGPTSDPAGGAWSALAEADLLGLALAEGDGGVGRGVLDACLVAEQVGRHVAPVPYWPTVAAALAVARWGTERQRSRWLPGALDGSGPLTVALWEPGTPGLPGPSLRPSTVATPDGDGWRLEGTRQPVPWASHAAAVVVPAALAPGGDAAAATPAGAGAGRAGTGDAEVALFLLDPAGPGVTALDEQVVSREPYQTLVLDGARVGPEGRLGPATGAPGAPLPWLAGRVTALVAATALGVAEGALTLTAAHVSGREQFGAPIGTFQAVAQRSADAYVDTEAMRLTTWQAAWQLDNRRIARPEPNNSVQVSQFREPGPGEALDVAAFWVAEGGQRVVHAAQHLHGGIGVDVDYPLHRYFRWAKVLELLVGGASGALLRLGASLAGEE